MVVSPMQANAIRCLKLLTVIVIGGFEWCWSFTLFFGSQVKITSMASTEWNQSRGLSHQSN